MCELKRVKKRTHLPDHKSEGKSLKSVLPFENDNFEIQIYNYFFVLDICRTSVLQVRPLFLVESCNKGGYN